MGSQIITSVVLSGGLKIIGHDSVRFLLLGVANASGNLASFFYFFMLIAYLQTNVDTLDRGEGGASRSNTPG